MGCSRVPTTPAAAASARGRARPSCRSRPPSGSPCPRPTRSPSTTTGGHSAAVGTVLHMVMTCRQCTVPSPSPQHEFCLSGTLIACVGVCPRRRAHVAAMAMVRYTVCKQTRSSSLHAPRWMKVAGRSVGRHAHGVRRVDGRAQPRAVWAVPGRVEGPASTDGADIARVVISAFVFGSFCPSPKWKSPRGLPHSTVSVEHEVLRRPAER